MPSPSVIDPPPELSEDYARLCVLTEVAQQVPPLRPAALAATEQLLEQTPETAGPFRGMLLAMLGQRHQALGDPGQAIACYKQALRYRPADRDPRRYGRTHLNLGNAYMEMPSSARPAALDEGIACYEEALLYLTASDAPGYRATALMNLEVAGVLERLETLT